MLTCGRFNRRGVLLHTQTMYVISQKDMSLECSVGLSTGGLGANIRRIVGADGDMPTERHLEGNTYVRVC